MRRTKRSAFLVSGAGGLLLALGAWVHGQMPEEAYAQSGSRYRRGSSDQTQRGSGSRQEGSQGRRQRRLPPEQFRDEFWKYLTETNPYTDWSPWPGKPGMYEGQSPHGAYLKMYVNRVAESDVERLPHKSIIVKENYGPDQKTLGAVTVMYKVKDYDPQHNDWYWIKYQPDGTVAQTPDGKPIAGRFASCINCHEDSDGGDYAFAND